MLQRVAATVSVLSFFLLNACAPNLEKESQVPENVKKEAGFVKSVERKDGSVVANVDFFEAFMNEDAMRQFAKDHPGCDTEGDDPYSWCASYCDRNEAECSDDGYVSASNNGFYLHNDSPKIFPITLSPNTKITGMDPDEDEELSPDEWIDYAWDDGLTLKRELENAFSFYLFMNSSQGEVIGMQRIAD